MGELSPLWCLPLALTTGCGMFVPRAYDSVDAQRCVETALRRAPDEGALPGAKARFAHACQQGDPAGCSTLGLMYELGLMVEPDPVKATKLYARSCEGGNDGGCTNLGLAYATGMGVETDPERAAQLFSFACEDGNPVACTEYALAQARGLGIDKDVASATTKLTELCDDGHANACFRLARMFDQGEVGPDPLLTISLFEKSCLGGLPEGCARLDTIYGETLPHNGSSLAAEEPKPPKKPAPVSTTTVLASGHPFEVGCAQGRFADCMVAGIAYQTGNGVKQDLNKATKLLSIGCRGGHEAACRIVSPILHGSCAKGDQGSCRALAALR